MQLIYHYHPVTKEAIGTSVAEYDPEELRRGRKIFIVPGNSTLIPAPSAPAGSVAVFNEGTSSWDTVIDHRGKTAYCKTDGSSMKVETVGELSVDYTFQPRPSLQHYWSEENNEWVLNLSEGKVAALAALQSQTKAYIDTKMPDWRLARWKTYYAYSKRGAANLDAVELKEYNAFPDAGETHADCARYVPLALSWVVNCILSHNSVEQEILAAQTAEAFLTIVKDTSIYPVWPL